MASFGLSLDWFLNEKSSVLNSTRIINVTFFFKSFNIYTFIEKLIFCYISHLHNENSLYTSNFPYFKNYYFKNRERLVRSVIPYSSTHLAKFVSSAHSNLVPHTHTLLTRLYLLFRFCCTGCPVIFGPLSLSLLIVKCHQVGPAGLMVRLDKESIVYPAIHNASRAYIHTYGV